MRDFFQRYVLQNLLLKIIALVCAVLLWSALAREPMVETAYSVPIEFHQMPPRPRDHHHRHSTGASPAARAGAPHPPAQCQ